MSAKSSSPLIECPADFSGAYTVPDGVTSIGNDAFSGCSALTSVNIPASVTTIAEGAFVECSALSVINVHPDNPNYASVDGVLFDKDLTVLIQCPAGFAGDYIIPVGIISIGDWAFDNCSVLTSVTIPDSVTSIGNATFAGCSLLASVIIPDSVTSIGNLAFNGCSSLTSVTIPASVTNIGWCAFQHCTSLTSVTIPDSVTSIGLVSFSECTTLTSISVHPNNPNYASVDGVLFDKKLTVLIRCPGGFSGACTIPDGVTSIDFAAFADCTSLTSIIIPNSATSIGDSAFSGCSALITVTIPDSVTTIGDEAFAGCSALSFVFFTGDAPTICSNAFDDTPATIYFRPGTSGWSTTIAGRPAVKREEMFASEEDSLCGKGSRAIGEFELTDEDMDAIKIAINVARRFLKNPQITPKQVIALGNALYALERLPLVTPGVATEFGIEYRAGTKEYSEMRYIDFRISESDFEISKGGSVYDKSRGSDSYSDPRWLVEAGGYRETECDLYNLEESIDEYLNLGAKLSISDESEINFE